MATEPRVNRGRQRNDAARAARQEQLANVQRDCMRLNEFASRIGISHQKAYNLANEGKIPAMQLGREWYVPIRAYDQWLAAQFRGASAQATPCPNCGHDATGAVEPGDQHDEGPQEFEQVAVDEPALLFEPDHLGRRNVAR